MNSSDPRVQRLLDRLLREPRFDLLLVENIGVRYYRYETRAPSIVVEHEAGRVLLGDAEELQRRRPTIWRQFDRIQVFTPRDAAAVADIAPDLAGRVRVNPFGVDLPAPGGDTEEEAGTLLFVGGFRHWPNVDAAVWLSDEIMPLLRDLVPHARLQIVGNDPPQPVRALANGDIAVVGRVPDVEPYVRRAAVVLAPVRVGGGMRVKVLQAMALGKAVVTTPLGAEGLAPPDPDPPLAIASEAADFASATARLLGSPSERAALGRRARAFVLAHHSWPAYRRRLEAVHAELVERRPAPEPSHR